MEGLLFLIFFTMYVVLSIVVIFVIAKLAKKLGRSPWVWGLFTTFIMYNLVFWDWIPSVVLQDYYCKTEGGSWLYKTPEKWAEENPGENPIWNESGKGMSNTGNILSYDLNERIKFFQKQSMRWPSIYMYEYTLVDKKTKEVLARSISFQCGSCGGGGRGFNYKFWLQRCKCAVEKQPADDKNIAAWTQYKTIKGND